jgi:hypothetical protein
MLQPDLVLLYTGSCPPVCVCVWGGGVYHPPQRKLSKKRGPNLRRGGPGKLELRNVLNIMEFSGKLV